MTATTNACPGYTTAVLRVFIVVWVRVLGDQAGLLCLAFGVPVMLGCLGAASGECTGSIWPALLLCTLVRGFCRHDLVSQLGTTRGKGIRRSNCRAALLRAGAFRLCEKAGLPVWRRTDGLSSKNQGARGTSMLAGPQFLPGFLEITVATTSSCRHVFHMSM